MLSLIDSDFNHDEISDEGPQVWIYEDDNFKNRYHVSDESKRIEYQSSSNLTTKQKGFDSNRKLRHDSTWIQHVTPLQQSSSHSTNSFKTRVIDVGETIEAEANIGIEIGLASKLESNRKTPHEWKDFGFQYNFLNTILNMF